MLNQFGFSSALILSLTLSQIALASAANAFVCTDSDAAVDWSGVGFDVPFPATPLALTTPGSYELSVQQLFNGGGTSSPFAGSASVTFVPQGVFVPIGPVASLIVAAMPAGSGAWLRGRRRLAGHHWEASR